MGNMVIDTWVQEDCTLGRLHFENFKCFTLELPWENNALNVSCIPDGTYPAEIYESPSKGTVILLKNVPGRTYIEIHAGNFTRQILGCILVGDGIRYLDSDGIPDVINSVTTLERLIQAVTESSDPLTVTVNRTWM